MSRKKSLVLDKLRQVDFGMSLKSGAEIVKQIQCDVETDDVASCEWIDRWESMSEEERTELANKACVPKEYYQRMIEEFDRYGCIGSLDSHDGPLAGMEDIRRKL